MLSFNCFLYFWFTLPQTAASAQIWMCIGFYDAIWKWKILSRILQFFVQTRVMQTMILNRMNYNTVLWPTFWKGISSYDKHISAIKNKIKTDLQCYGILLGKCENNSFMMLSLWASTFLSVITTQQSTHSHSVGQCY